MIFLTEMPAMVGPENDDRIPLMRALLQRIEQPAQLGISKADAGQPPCA